SPDPVRGVLVRDAGLDRDLFRIADDLVRRTTIAEYRWESLTIPASREGRQMTGAPLIRSGFPGGAVWMVPLAAGELGFIFADRYRDLDSEVIDASFDDVVRGRAGPDGSEGEPPIDEAGVRAWVADAFATR